MRGQTAFRYYLWWQKDGKMWCEHVRYKGSHGERLAQLVCELARVLIISGQSMNIAAFTTQDLREQGHKSCEAGYRANEELVVLRMFYCELRQ